MDNKEYFGYVPNYSVAKDIGKAAVTCADALIAELKKGTTMRNNIDDI